MELHSTASYITLSPYPSISMTSDCVIFKNKPSLGYKVAVLLIKRKNDPFKDYWALPGGFVGISEDTRDAAWRELKEETSIVYTDLEDRSYIDCWNNVGRDPRGRVISFVYGGWLPIDLHAVAGDDAAKLSWHDVDNLPNNIAFDHKAMIAYTHKIYGIS